MPPRGNMFQVLEGVVAITGHRNRELNKGPPGRISIIIGQVQAMSDQAGQKEDSDGKETNEYVCGTLTGRTVSGSDLG